MDDDLAPAQATLRRKWSHRSLSRGTMNRHVTILLSRLVATMRSGTKLDEVIAMTRLLLVAACLALGTTAVAADLGAQAPAKTPGVDPVNLPAMTRQGGDSVATAFAISTMPFEDSGTTIGYNDDYTISCDEVVIEQVECPPAGIPEGEPPLHDGYDDVYNGGCQSSTFQHLPLDVLGELYLCGVAGWYRGEADSRDTDWFIVPMGWIGFIEVDIEAEYDTYFFEIGPQDCASVGIIQQVIARNNAPAAMTITGYATGDPVWCWVGPTTFTAPGGGVQEYDYLVHFVSTDIVPTAPATWSTVKALFD